MNLLHRLCNRSDSDLGLQPVVLTGRSECLPCACDEGVGGANGATKLGRGRVEEEGPVELGVLDVAAGLEVRVKAVAVGLELAVHEHAHEVAHRDRLVTRVGVGQAGHEVVQHATAQRQLRIVLRHHAVLALVQDVALDLAHAKPSRRQTHVKCERMSSV